jgi:FkbM family methyltransferase
MTLFENRTFFESSRTLLAGNTGLGMKKFLRSVQVNFPFLQDLRWKVEPVVRRAMKSVHDDDWRAFSLLRLNSGPIIDVGAKRGQSIESFLLTLPKRKIFSFEPNRLLARQLARKYSKHPEIVINSLGLGDKKGTFTLYVPQYKRWIFDGLSSLDRNEAISWLGTHNLYNFDTRFLRCVEVDCDISTLDSFRFTPSLIKIDVQGTEISVLQGAEKTIQSSRPVILLESASDEIVEFLSRFEYRPYVYKSGELIKNCTDASNCFFLTDAHL